VENLPIRDDPEVFGMHENANINFQTQESERIMATILSIQPRISGKSANKTPD
jgi:dynein heavy chain, axonemal